MIQSVQTFNQYKTKTNFTNNDINNNFITKMSLSDQVTDSFTNSKQVAFRGNIVKVTENLLGDKGSKIGSKVKRFVSEVTESVGGSLRKLKGQDDLPISEKPITCDMQTNEKMQAELEKKANESVTIKFRKKDSEEEIKKAGHSVSSGDIDQNGYLTTSGKDKVNKPTSGASSFGNAYIASGGTPGTMGNAVDSSSVHRAPSPEQDMITYMIMNKIPPFDK